MMQRAHEIASMANVQRSQRMRVAILCDLAEENWPSMDLVGDMLSSALDSEHADRIASVRVRPELPISGSGKLGRFLGRFIIYPRNLARIANGFDVFHIVDHSYAHLVHSLPSWRTVVTCHDLDTFRCLLQPEQERRSAAFRMMTRRILSGLKLAACITCDTAATRDAILKHNLVAPEKLTVVHNGVSPEFSPIPDVRADGELARHLGRAAGNCPELLHVGSTIARKRIDVLLRVFAEIRRTKPCRLLRVGGPFTGEQQALATQLGVASHVDVLPRLETRLIAAAYRRATVTVLTSDAEGFGLPLIESLACGTPVVASDIAALREIAGNVVLFCPVADVNAFAQAVSRVMNDQPEIASLLTQAKKYSWSRYAAQMTEIYSKVLAW
jgi:glycosyltransferase involved in cell wall biosynthesis